MNNNSTILSNKVESELSEILLSKASSDGMPMVLVRVLSPVVHDLGELSVIHPTTNDPVLVSSKLGAIAIWFKF